MALPYPEGECFFKRSALKSETSDRFNAEDPAHFYSTMIVEMVWNKEAHHGSKQCNSPKGHPHKRSKYEIVYGGGGWQTHYGNWSWCPFTYGNPIYPSKRARHALCTYGYRFKRREYGDAAEAWFMFVPMPTREEKWVWMDRLTCVRAIYIPASYRTGEKYPDLCTYVHVNFTQTKTLEIEHQKPGATKNRTLECHKTWGLDVDEKTALGINPARLITALAIPREHRKVNAFSAKAIVLMDSADIPLAPLEQEFDDHCMADWAVVVSENQGLDIKWGEADMKSSWFLEYFKNAMAFAIGYVPLVGPFLAIGWNVAMSAILDDHEAFMDELREQIPSVQLTEGFIKEIKNLATDTRPQLKPNYSIKKKNEQDCVVFDAAALKEAKKRVDSKSEKKDQPEEGKERVAVVSMFRALDSITLHRLASDNEGAIMQMVNDEANEAEMEALSGSEDAEPVECLTELPRNAEKLADLLERLSKRSKIRYNEQWVVDPVRKNLYGAPEWYLKKTAAKYMVKKKN